MGLLEQYGSDAVRYWASSARLGLDAAFEETQIKIGRRPGHQVTNASKFACPWKPWDADEAVAAAALPGRLGGRWADRPRGPGGLADVVDAAGGFGVRSPGPGGHRSRFFWTIEFCLTTYQLVRTDNGRQL